MFIRRLCLTVVLAAACLVAHGRQCVWAADTLTTTQPAETAEMALPDSTVVITEADRAKLDSLIHADMLTADSIAMAVGAASDSLKGGLMLNPPKRFIPKSKTAMWLGIAFPGGGQIYNRKYWKLPIFYGGFLGCIYALNWNNQMYSDYKQAYLDIMDDDPDTKSYMDMLPLNYDITGKEDRFKDVFRRKKDYYRKYRDMSIFAMIGVWALSVIDAYVDAELSTFDISPDLTLHVAPGMFNTTDMTRNRVVTNTGVKVALSF